MSYSSMFVHVMLGWNLIVKVLPFHLSIIYLMKFIIFIINLWWNMSQLCCWQAFWDSSTPICFSFFYKSVFPHSGWLCSMWIVTSVWTCLLKRIRWFPLSETVAAGGHSSGSWGTWVWVSDRASNNQIRPESRQSPHNTSPGVRFMAFFTALWTVIFWFMIKSIQALIRRTTHSPFTDPFVAQACVSVYVWTASFSFHIHWSRVRSQPMTSLARFKHMLSLIWACVTGYLCCSSCVGVLMPLNILHVISLTVAHMFLQRWSDCVSLHCAEVHLTLGRILSSTFFTAPEGIVCLSVDYMATVLLAAVSQNYLDLFQRGCNIYLTCLKETWSEKHICFLFCLFVCFMNSAG